MRAKHTSLLAALTASACCLPALVLLFTGVGSATLGATLARHHWWFLAAGAVTLAIAHWQFLRERRSCSSAGCAMPRRRFTVVSLILGTLVVGVFAANSLAPLIPLSPAGSSGRGDTPPGLATVTIPVEGMTCFSCELHVQRVLKDLPGVESADASTARSSVVVIHDPAQIDAARMAEAINTNTGYHASLSESGSC
jgi:copper chaperone CopZ